METAEYNGLVDEVKGELETLQNNFNMEYRIKSDGSVSHISLGKSDTKLIVKARGFKHKDVVMALDFINDNIDIVNNEKLI